MIAAAPRTRVLLLIEDNPGDAQLVREMLSHVEFDQYDVVHVPRVGEALDDLKQRAVDIVVLDLQLPDCRGVETVHLIRERTGAVPIVVLTGSDDEELALACIAAGAQDYLTKNEMRAPDLRRAIGYAVNRVREGQERDQRRTMNRFHLLSSAAQGTIVTAALLGSGAVQARHPETFDRLVDAYYALLVPYLESRAISIAAPRDAMEQIITTLGDANGGPRDLVDVHVAALERARLAYDDAHARDVVLEARLLALEMMGLLVDYYRVGQRRRFLDGVRA